MPFWKWDSMNLLRLSGSAGLARRVTRLQDGLVPAAAPTLCRQCCERYTGFLVSLGEFTNSDPSHRHLFFAVGFPNLRGPDGKQIEERASESILFDGIDIGGNDGVVLVDRDLQRARILGSILNLVGLIT